MESVVELNLSRGLITVAMGDYFCYMAENLFRTYKLFDNHYPFYVLCDKSSAERLSKVFDGVLVLDDPHYNLMDKISIYEKTVFDETIYIDSDCFVTGNISFLFDRFEENGSAVSCLGCFDYLDERSHYNYRHNYFSVKTAEKYGFDKYIYFTGGLYFFRKSNQAQEMMSFCKSCLINQYDEEGLSRHGPRKSDECVMSVGMLMYGMKPLDLGDEHIMSYVYRPKGEWDSDHFDPKTIKWNLKPNSFFVVSDSTNFNILIAHWMTPLTKNIVYYNYAIRIKCLFEHKSFLSTVTNVFIGDLSYYFKKIKNWLGRQIKKIQRKVGGDI